MSPSLERGERAAGACVRLVEFPTQSQVECEPLQNLPIVLNKQAGIRACEVAVQTAILPERRRLAQLEIRFAVLRIRSSERQLSSAQPVTRFLKMVPEEGSARLDGMRSANPRSHVGAAESTLRLRIVAIGAALPVARHRDLRRPQGRRPISANLRRSIPG